MIDFKNIEKNTYIVDTSQHGKCVSIARVVSSKLRSDLAFIIAADDIVNQPGLHLDLLYSEIKNMPLKQVVTLDEQIRKSYADDLYLSEILVGLNSKIKSRLSGAVDVGFLSINIASDRYREAQFYIEFENAVESGLQWK